MKKETKIPLGERMCNALDIGAELLPRKTLIEIHGTSLVKIQGAGNIIFYSENEIRINLLSKKQSVSVRGEGLSCASYNRGSVGITGMINSVSFCKEEK